MRCYHFGNHYLSQIQQGIQAAHAQMELFVKYQVESPQKTLLYEWAENHKTTICLNGGNSASLSSTYATLYHMEHDLPYPFVSFREDQDSLEGAITNVAIVLPESVYSVSQELRSGRWTETSSWAGNDDMMTFMDVNGCILNVSKRDMQVIDLISSCRLA